MVFRPYQASSPEVEVLGAAVLAVSHGIMLGGVASELLAMEGLEDIVESGWYNQQKWLNVFRRIETALGSDTLFAVGTRIPFTAVFPPNLRSLAAALRSVDEAYHHNHRNGEIGCYEYRGLGEDAHQVRCSNPYPCDFDHGIVCALVERFRGNQRYLVTHGPSSCRKKGDDECRYIVTPQVR